jgi:beta-phosphoglucomutase-like phosphatase (HAD superfamily)
MPSQPSVVVIDLDGVILDSFRLHVASWTAIAVNFGKDVGAIEFENYKGVETRDALVRLCYELKVRVNESELDKLVRAKCIFRDILIGDISPKDVLPGAKKLITEASHLCERLVCFATTSACERILDQIQLRSSFTDVICGAHLRPPKSENAECLLKWLGSNGLDCHDVLYIDDAETAVRHARSSGIPSLLKSDRVAPSFELPFVDTLEGKCLLDLMRRASEDLYD